MSRQRRRLIVLTTDFGLADSYVGVLKGVILGIYREAVVVDLCHEIPPQDVRTAAFLLRNAWRYFPRDTIHVVVVDPGVGGARAAIAVGTPGGAFVAPDNGVLSGVLRDQVPGLPRQAGVVPASALGTQLRAVRLSNPAYWLPEVSATFHGRDLFAPVAAHLAAGIPFDRLGEPQETLYLLPEFRPLDRPDGTVVAHVVHVDRFGNLVTDLDARQAAGMPQPLSFRVRGRLIRGLYRYYAEGPELMALVGSSGYVEIAVCGGSAAGALGARVGDEVEVIAGIRELGEE